MKKNNCKKDTAGLIAVRLAEITVGIAFLLSGMGKMLDASSFGELISRYGFEWFSILSPAIIVLELFVGTCLILRILLRKSYLLSCLMLIVFTAAFAYANVVNGIEDCGCYGDIGTSMPVLVTYLRNLVLLVLVIIVWRRTKKHAVIICNSCKLRVGVLVTVMIVGAFWTGHTWMPSSFYMNRFAKPHKLIGVDVNSSVLGKYIQVSKDSTYVVWVFSYTCSSCINSVENIKQYQNGVADRFVPLAVTEDKNGRKRRLLDIDFTPKEVGNGLAGFVEVVPTLLYICDGKIKYVIEQMVPNVYNFKSIYLDMNNDEILESLAE